MKVTGLRISPDLVLPIDAVTETFAFLAKRGAGKTYAASVLAEEMLKAGAQVVVLDCLDVWWGLRSSPDGSKPGLPIAIFGGEHGDIPLEPTAGAFVADLLVSERLSAVLVVEGFSKADQRRFATDFAERLFARNREAMHLFLEEADRWAPQRPLRGEERLLGAFEEIVRRGRSKGIGATLITQRSAVLHKDVLTQTEVLVAMRTPAKHDRNAIKDWFDAHEADQVADVMSTVPSLQTGEAWVSSPYWLGVLQRVQFRRRETFDSSSTPKMGESRRLARSFADVDLAVVKEQMAATIERAEAEDPTKLRRRIAELEKALRTAQTAVPEPVVERVEIPVLDESLVAGLRSVVDELAATTKLAMDCGDRAVNAATKVSESLGAWVDRQDVPRTRPARGGAGPVARREAERTAQRADPPGRREQGRAAVPGAAPAELPAGPAGLLRVLAARFPAWLTRRQVVTLARRGPKSSALDGHFAQLLEAGLIERDGAGYYAATEAGLAAVGGQVTDDPVEAWHSAFTGATQKVFDALVGVYPERYTRDGIAGLAGLSPTSSSVGQALTDLRRNGLIEEYSDGIQAADILFEGRR